MQTPNTFNDEKSPPKYEPQDESFEDASLMHGLPASMKKLREMSLDRSRPHSPKTKYSAPHTDNVDENNSIDLNLKFFNKAAIKSNTTTNIIHLKKQSNMIGSPHGRNSVQVASGKRMNPMSRFKKRVPKQYKNVSFENSPRELHHVKSSQNVAKYNPKMIDYNQPADYMEDEVNSQMMRETFSQLMPDARQNLYPEEDIEYEEQRVKPLDSVTIRQQREELEMERMRMERTENPDYYKQRAPIQRGYSPYNKKVPSAKHSQINDSQFENRSRSQNQRIPNNYSDVYQAQELPSINNRRNSFNSKS